MIGADEFDSNVKLLAGISEIDQGLNTQMPSNAINHLVNIRRCKSAEMMHVWQSHNDSIAIFDDDEIRVIGYDFYTIYPRYMCF